MQVTRRILLLSVASILTAPFVNGQGYPANCQTCNTQTCNARAYPDAGWAPPARLPVNRDGIWYQNYTPNAHYGNPGGGFKADHPMVYQPTDTTQLGYSYAKVPTWRPRPEMIPRVPSPSAFHTRVCPGCNSNHGCQRCQGHHQGVIFSAPNPNARIHPAPAVTRQIPANSQIRPAVATDKAAPRNWFRLTSLTNLFD